MSDDLELRAQFLNGREGDRKAQHAFLSNVSVSLRGYFRKRLHNHADAEDLVQEVLLALHTRRESYDAGYPLTAWIFAIARHRLSDFRRRGKRRNERSLEGLELAANDPSFDASDARRELGALLARLSPKQQTVIRLVKLEQRHVYEAAAITQLTASDIKISTHRALRSMQKWTRRTAIADQMV